eukprot:6188859-Pleurochrysis_carterae.AAC.1
MQLARARARKSTRRDARSCTRARKRATACACAATFATRRLERRHLLCRLELEDLGVVHGPPLLAALLDGRGALQRRQHGRARALGAKALAPRQQ